MTSANIYKLIGEYKHYTRCRFCQGRITPVIDLGYVPLAGGFIKKNAKKSEFIKEKFYPLLISFCTKCYLLQVNCAINVDILFKDYFYFSSSIKTLVEHFENNVKNLTKKIPPKKSSFIVEIGCNDGSFIKACQRAGYSVVGVDPATNIVKPLIEKGLPIVNNYFTEKVAKEIVEKKGKADAIYSFHSLAHIEGMGDVLKGIKILLKDNGFLSFEVHYLGDLLKDRQYDMIYHEHLYYYSLLTLQKFFEMYDMEIFDVSHTSIRGGSMMYYVQSKKGARKISSRVKKLIDDEIKRGLNNIKTYKQFSEYIKKTRSDLLKLIQSLKAKGKSVAGYGASGRGTVIMNYCGLDKKYLDYVIDDAPAKHGAFTPGTQLRIVPSTILNKKKSPDAVILFAWPFIDEVLKKNVEYINNGGTFIVPLPKVRIITSSSLKNEK